MTVETTLQDMYDNFPTLFSNRQECYDHLFCTNGNGCTWKWGQIVEDVYGLKDMEEIHANDYKNPKTSKAKQSEENIKMKQDMDRGIHNCLREGDIEDGKEDPGEYDPNKHHWYPLCEYALLFEIPSVIKPDWFEATKECLQALKRDKVEIPSEKTIINWIIERRDHPSWITKLDWMIGYRKLFDGLKGFNEIIDEVERNNNEEYARNMCKIIHAFVNEKEVTKEVS